MKEKVIFDTNTVNIEEFFNLRMLFICHFNQTIYNFIKIQYEEVKHPIFN